MAFDLNALAIHKILRYSQYHTTTDALLWSATQIKDFSLNVTTDTLTISDAQDMPIMEFDKGKQCECSGTNAIFDMGLLAAQSGTSKVLSSETSFTAFAQEIITVPASGTTVTLKHTPAAAGADGIPFCYKIKGDDSTTTTYSYAAAAGAAAFTFSTTTFTLPTGLTAGDRLMVPYYYTANSTDEAVKVTNTAVDFTTPGRGVLEILAHDPCDPSSIHYAMIIFPNARLSGSFDLGLASDSGHPFSLKAMQDYCDAEKKLFEFIVPDDVA